MAGIHSQDDFCNFETKVIRHLKKSNPLVKLMHLKKDFIYSSLSLFCVPFLYFSCATLNPLSLSAKISKKVSFKVSEPYLWILLLLSF